MTEPVTIALDHVGRTAYLSGGYRRGFAGTTSFALKNYRIDYDLGLASQEVELLLSNQGICLQESYSHTASD